jgi:hypothetical protein
MDKNMQLRYKIQVAFRYFLALFYAHKNLDIARKLRFTVRNQTLENSLPIEVLFATMITERQEDLSKKEWPSKLSDSEAFIAGSMLSDLLSIVAASEKSMFRPFLLKLYLGRKYPLALKLIEIGK